MSPGARVMSFALVWLLAYLVGGIPFGYLVARLKGVDLFKAGSGNIGATNVGRVLGRRYGVLVFTLDFLKGAVPVLAAVPLASAIDPDSFRDYGSPDVLRVGAAALAFLGHLYPVYLRFRGGKGVATGAGAVAVLVPGPTTAAVLAWVLVVLATRYVSLASIVAAGVLCLFRVLGTDSPDAVTGFCVIASLLVVAKHRANVGRLLRGTENTTGDGPMRQRLLRVTHLLALGFWFGGAGFFNFVVAPTHNRTFAEVVRTAPNDRTLGLPLLPPDAPDAMKADLGSALFGAAVGPVFPLYFRMQAVCGAAALATACAWWPLGGVHRWRVFVVGLAVLTVAVGWPVSEQVTHLRLARLAGDAAAKDAFAAWHFVSLGLSVLTVGLAGGGLALAGWLPERSPEATPAESGGRNYLGLADPRGREQDAKNEVSGPG